MDERRRLKTQAEMMRLLLEYDLCTKADVIAWADREVEEAERPDPDVINVALATSVRIQDLLGLLRAIPGECEVAKARAVLLEKLAVKLRANPDKISDVIRTMLRIALCGDAPGDRATNRMRAFENDYELAVHTGRNIEDLRREILEFLEGATQRGRATDEFRPLLKP